MKKRNILLGLALAFCFTACYDLDKMPEGVLSTAEPFRSTGEIRNYIDRYYEFGVTVTVTVLEAIMNLVSVRKGSWLVVEVVLPVMMLTVIIWHLLLSIRA